MNKTILQELVHLRLQEAKVLLDASCYQGAYYLAGYAIECAIKVCITNKVKAFDFPNKQLAQKAHIHDLADLITTAELKQLHTQKMTSDSDFSVYWAIVKDWNSESRYTTHVSEQVAKDMFEAVTNPTSGILEWLKKYW